MDKIGRQAAIGKMFFGETEFFDAETEILISAFVGDGKYPFGSYPIKISGYRLFGKGRGTVLSGLYAYFYPSADSPATMGLFFEGELRLPYFVAKDIA